MAVYSTYIHYHGLTIKPQLDLGFQFQPSMNDFRFYFDIIFFARVNIEKLKWEYSIRKSKGY